METKRILVVEDEADILMLIKRSLDMKSFNVIPAESGARALELFREATPDLILLDIMMSDMDGYQVCEQIRRLPGGDKIPIVFLTVRNNQEDRERSREAGVVLYLTKPFDPFKLGEEIEKLLAAPGV